MAQDTQSKAPTAAEPDVAARNKAWLGAFRADVASALTVDMIFDYLGVRLIGPKAGGKRIVVNFKFSDSGRSYVLNLENSALTYVTGRLADQAGVTLTRSALLKLLANAEPGSKNLDGIKIEGDATKRLELAGLFDSFPGGFPIVEPKPQG